MGTADKGLSKLCKGQSIVEYMVLFAIFVGLAVVTLLSFSSNDSSIGNACRDALNSAVEAMR